MKKRLFALILPLAAMTLAGCVKYNGKNKDGSPKSTSHHTPTDTQAPTTEPTPVTPGVDVTYYLNLGEEGYLEEQPDVKVPGSKIEAVHLEHGIAKTGKSGDKLLTATKVKSTRFGVVFKHWVLSGTQDIYTELPDINGCILVAVFATTSDYERTVYPATMGFGLKFNNDTYYVGTRQEDEPGVGRMQYCIHNAYFRKGETFQLWNFETKEGWASVDLVDPYSCGGSDASSTNWLNYFRVDDGGSGKFVVQKDFVSEEIYMKFAYENDQMWIK